MKILSVNGDIYMCHGYKGIQAINNKYICKFKKEVLDYYGHNMLLREMATHFIYHQHFTIKKWQEIYKYERISGQYRERRGKH